MKKEQEAKKGKELRRLSRRNLLEMLLEQSVYVEKLQDENIALKKQLSEREIIIKESGTLAEAALRLNDVFSAADAAAEQYLYSLREAVNHI